MIEEFRFTYGEPRFHKMKIDEAIGFFFSTLFRPLNRFVAVKIAQSDLVISTTSFADRESESSSFWKNGRFGTINVIF